MHYSDVRREALPSHASKSLINLSNDNGSGAGPSEKERRVQAPSSKLQAPSSKPQLQAPSSKLQAPSPSSKLQAASSKLANHNIPTHPRLGRKTIFDHSRLNKKRGQRFSGVPFFSLLVFRSFSSLCSLSSLCNQIATVTV